MTTRRQFIKSLGGIAAFTIVPECADGYVAPSDELAKGSSMEIWAGHISDRQYRVVRVMLIKTICPGAGMVNENQSLSHSAI